MATTITIEPAEKGTAKITIGPFTDMDTPPNEVTPLTLTWTLTTRAGVAIGSRTNVSATPASTVSILLAGNDLAMPSADPYRIIAFSWTYNSTDGSGLTGRAQAIFKIEQFVSVT